MNEVHVLLHCQLKLTVCALTQRSSSWWICWMEIKQVLCSYLSLIDDGAQLPYTDSFKYPSMLRDRHINMKFRFWILQLIPITAGAIRIKQFVRGHDRTNRLNVYMWLLKAYTIPAGM